MRKGNMLWKSMRFQLLLLLFLVIGSVILAETTSSLTLEQAIELALKYDYQVKTAANDLEKAKLAVKQEVLKVFPQADITGLYQYNMNNETYPDSFTVVISETIPTKMNLYGKKVVSSIDVALWDQMNSEAQLQITKANVIYNTTQKFLNALKTQQVLQLQEIAVKNAQLASDIALEQLRYGKITKTTQLKAESDLANASFNLEQGQANYEIAMQQLKNQLGLDESAPVTLMDDTKNFKTENIDASLLKTKALTERLELQQAKIVIKKAERSLAQARNQGLPVISLSHNNISDNLSYSVSYNFLSGDLSWNAAQQNQGRSGRTVQGPGSSDNTRDYFGNSQQNISLKFTWTLDFGIARNQSAQAQISLENAKLSQYQTMQTVRSDVEQAVSDYKIALKKTETNQKAIPYYQKDLEIKKLQNQLGTVTLADVSTAEQNLLQAQIEVIKSSYDQLVAYQKLKEVCGGLYPFETRNSNIK